jgi:GT2 family glycosyltransferase
MSEPSQNRLSCVVGIATYQRADILLDCLRYLRKQTRMPEEIIVADSSPDTGPVRDRIARELPDLPKLTRFAYLDAPRGLAVQRNYILDHTQCDVILFPDDDTLVSPEYTEKIMAVYEADRAGQVGGIEGAVTEGPAAPVEATGQSAPRPGLKQRLRELVQHWGKEAVDGILGRFGLPYYPPGTELPVHGVPDSVKHLPVVAIRNLYGCVMSYRRPLAAQYRFNENLKTYSYMEDFEMSFRVGKDYALLRCLNAPARHLRIQGGRLDPSLVHYLCLINVAYIGRTALDWTPAVRKHIERHAHRDAVLEFGRGFVRKTGFSHYRAARAGLKWVREILAAAPADVLALYMQAAEEGYRQKAF